MDMQKFFRSAGPSRFLLLSLLPPPRLGSFLKYHSAFGYNTFTFPILLFLPCSIRAAAASTSSFFCFISVFGRKSFAVFGQFRDIYVLGPFSKKFIYYFIIIMLYMCALNVLSG